MQPSGKRDAPSADLRIHYGSDPNQFADLWLPKNQGTRPALIMIHGGFWRSAYGVESVAPMCQMLRIEGVACIAFEYRRVGQRGGGWPGTLDDMRSAGRWVAEHAANYNFDGKRIAVAGHSAGGQLAFYLAAERAVPLCGAISLAGIVDLRRAFELKLGTGAVGEFLAGSPAQQAARYKTASPSQRVPLGIPTRLLHGVDDTVVPLEISRLYTEAAKAAGDDVRLIPLQDTGHGELIDPTSVQWRIVSPTLRALLH